MDGFRSGNHETSGRHTRRHFLTRRCRITMRVTSSSFYFSFFFRTRFLVSLKQWDQTLPPLSVTKPGFIFLSFFFFRIISTLLFARYTRYTNEWKNKINITQWPKELTGQVERPSHLLRASITHFFIFLFIIFRTTVNSTKRDQFFFFHCSFAFLKILSLEMETCRSETSPECGYIKPGQFVTLQIESRNFTFFFEEIWKKKREKNGHGIPHFRSPHPSSIPKRRPFTLLLKLQEIRSRLD